MSAEEKASTAAEDAQLDASSNVIRNQIRGSLSPAKVEIHIQRPGTTEGKLRTLRGTAKWSLNGTTEVEFTAVVDESTSPPTLVSVPPWK